MGNSGNRQHLSIAALTSCRASAILTAALMLAAALPAPARAAPASADVKLGEAKALEAKAYFKNGLFKEAADTFMEAYALSKAPDMMYNAARAYEQAGLLERAVALFESYLGLKNVSEEGRREAQERIAHCKAVLAGRAGPQSAERVQPPSSGGQPDGTPAEATGAEAKAAGTADPGRPSGPEGIPAIIPKSHVDEQSTGLDGLTLGLLGSGAALVGGAGALYGWAFVVAKHANDDLTTDPAATLDTYNTAFDKAERLRWAAVGAGAVGGAALGWGCWRWLRGETAAAPIQASWWGPSGRGAGIVLGGRF